MSKIWFVTGSSRGLSPTRSLEPSTCPPVMPPPAITTLKTRGQ